MFKVIVEFEVCGEDEKSVRTLMENELYNAFSNSRLSEYTIQKDIVNLAYHCPHCGLLGGH